VDKIRAARTRVDKIRAARTRVDKIRAARNNPRRSPREDLPNPSEIALDFCLKIQLQSDYHDWTRYSLNLE
jgi:hypothetical protein